MSATPCFPKASVFLLAACAFAGSVSAASDAPAGIPPPEEDRSEFSTVAIEQLSEAELKDFYLRCAREAMRQRLGAGEIALCSIGYERLLKGTFRGDFHALLEWRRAVGRRAEPVHSPF